MLTATGLYIHVPFCFHKCRYCDFYSVRYEPELLLRYTSAVVKEVRSVGGIFRGRTIDTIYFGGGTPSIMDPAAVEQILVAVSDAFSLAPGAEISLEANPGSFDYYKMAGFRQAGVNRVSVGAQSFYDKALHTLGRSHTGQDVYRAVQDCHRAGFENLNLDLIYGIPGQDAGVWVDNLEQAVGLNPSHISAYLLQPEPGTPMGRLLDRGELSLWPEEEELAQYETTIDFLAGAGYRHYEISNFALPGYTCQHNLIYWRGDDYVGIGPGAVSFTGGRRYQKLADVRAYLEALEEGQQPPGQELERLAGRTLLQDRIILGLRLTEGVDCERLQAEYDMDVLAEFRTAIKKGEAAGLLEAKGMRIRLTRKGYFLSNQVFREFLG